MLGVPGYGREWPVTTGCYRPQAVVRSTQLRRLLKSKAAGMRENHDGRMSYTRGLRRRGTVEMREIEYQGS